MRVLITGSTASQSNPLTHTRSTNFAGLLKESLEKVGSDVDWMEPSVTMTLESLSVYDRIFVGLASPLGLGSNRIYGALSLIKLLWDDPRLVLFIDAPDPNNITRGIQSVCKNPGSLHKQFFAGRREFSQASDPRARVRALSACQLLRGSEWPTTLVPGFPWTFAPQVEEELPEGAVGNVIVVNLDRLILREYRNEEDPLEDRDSRWMAEKGSNRKWLREQRVSSPVVGLRTDHRIGLKTYHKLRLSSSMGLLLPPGKKSKTWWTPKVAIALSQNTPVFTSWSDARVMGKYWTTSPAAFEDLSSEEQRKIGQMQYETYLNAIPNSGQINLYLSRLLGMEVEDNV